VLGIDTSTLVRIAREGFKRGFMDEDERSQLLQRFDTEARHWCNTRGVVFPD
jgi:hypothetical protein